MVDKPHPANYIGAGYNRQHYDFYITPPEAVYALLEVEKFEGKTIWEPASGNGAISKILEKELPDFEIISSDIRPEGYGYGGVNFLARHLEVDNIITNPPYSLAEEFARHGLECARHKVALLLRLVFLEGQKRATWLWNSGLRRVWIFTWRIKFERGDGKQAEDNMIAMAWFIWEKGYKGDVIIAPLFKRNQKDDLWK